MDIGWKIVSAGAGIVSGIIANKVVDVVWKVGAVVSELVVRRAAKWYGFESVARRPAPAAG